MFAIWTPTCAHPTMSKEPHSGADAPPGPASPTVVLGPLTVSLAGGPGRLTQICSPSTTDAHCKEPSLLFQLQLATRFSAGQGTPSPQQWLYSCHGVGGPCPLPTWWAGPTDTGVHWLGHYAPLPRDQWKMVALSQAPNLTFRPASPAQVPTPGGGGTAHGSRSLVCRPPPHTRGSHARLPWARSCARQGAAQVGFNP